MLLYEFNDTPCVIVTKDGEVHNLAQFLLGWHKGDDAKQLMKDRILRWAKEGNTFGLEEVQ